jgi:ABC-type branched-subunit amino acid transport system permease subunit
MAAIVAAAGAAVIGMPAFRIRGLYLAVATLAFGIAAERWLFRLTAVSGGSEGVGLPPMSARSLLGLAIVLLAAATSLALRVAATRGGGTLRVLHHDETLAVSWGIDTRRAKLFAFTLSGLLAGAAGGVYAGLVGHLTSEVFSAERSITLVAMAIVGGLGSVGGVVAGSVLFAVLPEVLHGAAQWLTLVYSGVLLAVVLLLPGGLAELWTPAP